jgi:replicative DNA helicase
MRENFSVEAEQSVIGSIIQDNISFDLIHTLQANAFYNHNHADIFRVIISMMAEQKPVDVLTLAEVLESQGKLTGIGGINYLIDIARGIGTSANIKRYAEIVQEKAMLRALLAAVTEIQTDVNNPGEVYAKLNRAQSAIMAITEKVEIHEPQFVGDLLAGRMERIDQAYNDEIKLISTGLTDLDTQLGGGIENGSFIVIAASSSMGKTSLAVQLAEAIQTTDGVSLIFTIEMMNGLVVDRMIAGKSKISSAKLRTGKLEDEDWDKLINAVEPLKRLNVMLDDRTNNLNSMRSTARSIKRKHGLNCIVVDYIGLMVEEADTREQQISNITRGLKSLAKELDVPMIALSQLNRKVSDRTNKRPLMSDLRDSGAIEQDADVIMLIYRDEYYHPDSQYVGIAEINVAKNRNGATGSVMTHFDKEHTVFHNYAGGMPTQEVKKTRGSYYD